jgi:hypothetical protein
LCVLTFLLIVPGGYIAATDFGIKIGLSSSGQSFSFTDNRTLDTRRKLGPEFGFFAERKFIGRANISASVKLVEKGMVRHFPVYNDDKIDSLIIGYDDATSHVNYVSVALLTKVYFPFRKVSYYLIAGPRVDIKYGSREEPLISSYYDGFNTIVLGGSIGIGLGYGGKYGGVLFFEIIYNPDFQNAFSNPELKVKNSSISFLMGFKV